MTTEKQVEANRQNTQLSTGPVTTSGKATVAVNAIKHGIFTKDLILSSGINQENAEEYQQLLNNLMDSLSPCNQIESLLVEKIAVDFWRMRRTIRFETGSITQGIKELLHAFYSHGKHNNEDIDKDIQRKQEWMAWNKSYIECLSKGKVTFEQPQWEGDDIIGDIIGDFYLIAKSIDFLTKKEKESLYDSYSLDFETLQALLKKYGYSEVTQISTKLIELYSEQNEGYEQDIQELTKQKLMNDESDKLTCMLGMIPMSDNTDKVLKYERSLQKSIFQNLIMLKKLQAGF